jgi:hypothetical protein
MLQPNSTSPFLFLHDLCYLSLYYPNDLCRSKAQHLLDLSALLAGFHLGQDLASVLDFLISFKSGPFGDTDSVLLLSANRTLIALGAKVKIGVLQFCT